MIIINSDSSPQKLKSWFLHGMAAKPKRIFDKQESLPSCRITEAENSCIDGLSCPVCCEAYCTHDDAKTPRILSSCGHTLCSGKPSTKPTIKNFVVRYGKCLVGCLQTKNIRYF